MRSLILLAAMAVSMPISVAAEPAPTKAVTHPTAADPLKALYRNTDKMEGISWYSHKSSPKYSNANGVYLYFGKQESGTITPLRLRLQYYSDSWLFVQDAWARVDGDRISLPQSSKRFSGWERDNSSGNIWEWSDTALTTHSEIASVRKLAFAKTAVVRFEGQQYRDDRILSDQQLKAMREVIGAYEAATGKPWQ